MNVEVFERPVRRRFTAEYQARILAAADAYTVLFLGLAFKFLFTIRFGMGDLVF